MPWSLRLLVVGYRGEVGRAIPTNLTTDTAAHLNRKARRRVNDKVSTRHQRRYGLEVDLQNVPWEQDGEREREGESPVIRAE